MKRPYFHCRKLAAPIGSNRYYACRYMPFRQRKAIFGLYAFDNAVFSIPFLVSDPDVARAKLQWWRTAVTDLFNTGDSAHPILKCLKAYLTVPGWQPELFIKYIDTVEYWLDFDIFQTNLNFLNFSARTSGILAKLAAFLFVEPCAKTNSFASHFAVVTDVTHYIKDLDAYSRYNKLPFSHELLHRLHIHDNALSSPPSSSHFLHLLKDQIPFVQSHIDAALSVYPQKQHKKLRYFRIMMQLALAQLDYIYEKTANTSEVKPNRDMMPFKKLWIAFRTH